MSELPMVSPLLDHMSVEGQTSGRNDGTYCLRDTVTGERFTLKQLSIPASDSQIRALILSGAYPNEAAVHEYYGRVVNDIKAELEAGKALASSGSFAGASAYQIVPKETGIGYDVYILYSLHVSLQEFMWKTPMTNLRAVNLGIDLCDAISACRDAGYLFGNIRPETVFFTTAGRFLLGGLGLVSLADLKYACMPEDYIGAYSAPELSDITASPNLTVDLYSLGMVLYRVYNGGHGPFEDEHTGEAMADKLRLTGKQLPTPIYADYEMAAIILKACAFRQQDRYQTPEELKQALVLYMQRNEVSDTLIAPPIVSAPTPIAPLAAEEEEPNAPMHMTDAQQLDDKFRHSFAPDLTGAGTEADIDAAAAPVPAEPPKPPISQPEPPAPERTAEPASVEPAAAQPEANEADASQDIDPNQMDIDALLASVSRYVDDAPAVNTPDEAAPVEHNYIDAPVEDEREEPDEPSGKKKRGGKLGGLLIVLALLVALAGAAYAFITWYFVDVSNLNVVSCTPSEIVIELLSEDSQDRFVLTCTDSYGNAYPGVLTDNRYTFSNLTAQTSYTVTVRAAKYHRLTSASTYSQSVATPGFTEISDFTAIRTDTDGEVQLTFSHNGPTPVRWKLSYTDGSGQSTPVEFEGNSCLITGLQQGTVYTFTLESVDGIYLSGQTSVQYELLPIVEAKNLNVTNISGSDVTVAWEPGENVPEEWTVTCEADGFSVPPETVTSPSYTLRLPDLSRDYTFSVTARGMDTPETLLLPSDPLVIEGLSAAANDDGSVTVSWSTPAGTPAGGWYVSYKPVGSLRDERYVTCESGNSVTLHNLAPSAEYQISLQLTAQDAASKIFGNIQTNVTTPEAIALDDFTVSPTPPLDAAFQYITLRPLPAQEDWDFSVLDSPKSTFGTDEGIAVCLEVNSVVLTDDEVTLLYVIRDAEGHVVNDDFKDTNSETNEPLTWQDIWYRRRHASAIPLPAKRGEASQPGDYTLEIYVNGKLLSSIDFTIA